MIAHQDTNLTLTYGGDKLISEPPCAEVHADGNCFHAMCASNLFCALLVFLSEQIDENYVNAFCRQLIREFEAQTFGTSGARH